MGGVSRSNHSPSGSRLLTIEEAAAYIHSTVSPNAIRTAIRNNQLRAIKIGHRYYVSEIEIRRFIECPDPENLLAFTNERMMELGSSSMEENKSGLAMVMDFVTKQKNP